jgi:hypothetical protein
VYGAFNFENNRLNGCKIRLAGFYFVFSKRL